MEQSGFTVIRQSIPRHVWTTARAIQNFVLNFAFNASSVRQHEANIISTEGSIASGHNALTVNADPPPFLLLRVALE